MRADFAADPVISIETTSRDITVAARAIQEAAEDRPDLLRSEIEGLRAAINLLNQAIERVEQ